LNRTRTLIIAAFAISIALWGCGKFKDKDDKVIRVLPGDLAEGEGYTWNGRPISKEMKMTIDALVFFVGNEGVCKGAFKNIIQQGKSKLDEVMSGDLFTSDEIVNIFFRFDSNEDGCVSLDELVNTMSTKVPSLKWLSSPQPISPATLREQIVNKFPEGSDVSRGDLVNTLLRFDDPDFGGNGNGVLDQSETGSFIQWIFGYSDLIDFSIDYEPNGNLKPIQQITLKILMKSVQHKVTQQIYRKYSVADHRKLLPTDYKLEIIQIILKYFLVDRMFQKFAPLGVVELKDADQVLSHFGLMQRPHWKSVRGFYDSYVMGGNQDGKLSTFESFNLLTDLDYAKQFLLHTSLVQPQKSFEASSYFLSHLASLYSATWVHVGNDIHPADLFWTGSTPRAEYWKSLQDFDKTNRGGNNDSQIDAGELALGFAYAKVTDLIFYLLDRDKNGIVTKDEFLHYDLKEILKELANKELSNQLADVFFDNVGLSGGKFKFIEFLVYKISNLLLLGQNQKQELTPYEFHTRMEQILPALLQEFKEQGDNPKGKGNKPKS
jgi:Ca2+-binding EF-hand superfamily protein